MKAIDLTTLAATLGEVLDLAGRENVIVRTPEGREFVVAEIDDFAQEVAATGANAGLARLLAERSGEPATVSLVEAKRRLQDG